jgi:triacylglycerol lipase
MKNPVLLIHGILKTNSVFNVMSDYLTKEGWQVHRFDLKPNNATVGLDQLALQIDNYVKNNFSENQPFDLVGFSMGGLISRYYIQRLGGIERVQRFITISSPHNGTLMAHLLPFTGCQQMRPNSEFLRDLNQDINLLNKLDFTSIWTPFDLMILPAKSSQLPIGKEVILPVLAHAVMPRDNRTIRAVVESLSAM